MGFIKNEDIMGYKLSEGRIFCCECTDKELDDDEVSEDMILTEGDKDNFDGVIFCDCCKERI